MIQGMIGQKAGDDADLRRDWRSRVPVTVIECGPNVVTQVRTHEKDGYEAVQLGFGIDKRAEQARAGPSQGERLSCRATLREVKADDASTSIEVGQLFKADTFSAGELVDVTGTSKGKGFQGGVKRHGFARRPEDARSVRPLARAGLDRLERDAGPRLQGHQDGRSHGQRAGDGAESRSCARRPRAQPAAGQGLGSGPEQWHWCMIRQAIKAQQSRASVVGTCGPDFETTRNRDDES